MSAQELSWNVVLRADAPEEMVLRLLTAAARRHLHPRWPVPVMLADGSRDVAFERLEAAARHLCVHGGGLAVYDDSLEDELFVSVHPRRGIELMVALELGEPPPRYDAMYVSVRLEAAVRRSPAWEMFAAGVPTGALLARPLALRAAASGMRPVRTVPGWDVYVTDDGPLARLGRA
jgi:hypothetical protein